MMIYAHDIPCIRKLFCPLLVDWHNMKFYLNWDLKNASKLPTYWVSIKTN